MIKALWLCSWYPSDAAPFNGDFVQRHAQAAALYTDIHIIHVAGWGAKEKKFENRQVNLYEHILLYKSKKGLVGKFFNHLNWEKYFISAVEKYISTNGLPDIVHVHVPMKAGLIARWIKKKFGIPYVVTEHWGIYNNVLSENFNNKPFLFKWLTKKIFKDAAACSSVSKYLADSIKTMILPDLDFTVINNVVDTSHFYSFQKEPGKFRFIHVSNMIKLKNADKILAVFNKSPDLKENAELVFAGDKEGVIRTSAERLGLLNKSVFVKGEISYHDVALEMQQSDCLVLFSDIENSPCVISEALCCGLPIIATNAGGIPELLKPEYGVLINPGEETQLCEAMIRMLQNRDSYDKTKIAKEAQERFSYSVIGKKITDLYRSVIEKE